jgi:hypothetical protein
MVEDHSPWPVLASLFEMLMELPAGILTSRSTKKPRLPTYDSQRSGISAAKVLAPCFAAAALVPGYSGGTVTDSHRLPLRAPEGADNLRMKAQAIPAVKNKTFSRSIDFYS